MRKMRKTRGKPVKTAAPRVVKRNFQITMEFAIWITAGHVRVSRDRLYGKRHSLPRVGAWWRRLRENGRGNPRQSAAIGKCLGRSWHRSPEIHHAWWRCSQQMQAKGNTKQRISQQTNRLNSSKSKKNRHAQLAKETHHPSANGMKTRQPKTSCNARSPLNVFRRERGCGGLPPRIFI